MDSCGIPNVLLASSGYSATMALRMGTQFALKGLGKSVLLSLASSITPAGWVVIGVVVVGGVIYAKTKNKDDVDPYASAGQKKQGREVKSKSRQKSNFNPRNNKRDKKPAKPKKHTPSRKGHTKY